MTRLCAVLIGLICLYASSPRFSWGASSSVVIDSVLVISDPEFVFSNPPLFEKRATLHITVYDENDQPVGPDVPIAINVDDAIFKGSSLFKSEISADTSGNNTFYFKTDANGQIAADFYPYKFLENTFDGIKNNYLYSHPEATEEEILEEYKQWNTAHILIYDVRFRDPNDEQTAYPGSQIAVKQGSVFPVLYAYNSVIINGAAEDGSPYIFTGEKFEAEPVEVTIQALDMFGQPLPAGCFLYIRNFWGVFQGEPIVTENMDEPGTFNAVALQDLSYNPAFKGGGEYYIKIGEQGKAKLIYQPPPTTMIPFSNWAWYNTEYIPNYKSKEEAWKVYTGNDIAIPGTSVFYEIKGASPFQDIWTGYKTTIDALSIDSSKSVIPVLVGVDQIEIETVSDRNDHYVYASRTYSESVTLKIRAYDAVGRPAPEGAYIALYLNHSHSPVFEGTKAIITGPSIEAKYVLDQDHDVFYIIQLGIGGEAEVEYRAPFIDFNADYHEGTDSQGFTYDEKYSGLARFFPVPFYGWWDSAERDAGYEPYWLVPYWSHSSLKPFVNTAKETFDNTFPVVIGPAQARAYFHPPTLWPFQYMARLNVYVQDAFGNPAPKGSNIYVSVSSGAFSDGEQSTEAIISGKDGRATLTYFSPTRSSTFTWGYATASVTKGITSYTSRKIKLVGPAVAWHDFNLSKWLLGFDIVEFIQGLNPLKVLGALKEFVEYSENMAKQLNAFYLKLADGTATDADFQAYEQNWRILAQHIAHLAETVPNTSLTGPDLSAGELFQGLAINGLRHTLRNTLEEKFVKGPMKKMLIDFLNFHLSKLFPGSSGKTLAGVTYSLHPAQKVGDLELLTDLYTLPSESGMYEMYGFRFRLYDLDSLIVHGAVQIGDQWPLDKFIIPERYALAGYPEDAVVLSNGFFEITEINAQENYVEGIAVGYLYPNPQLSPVLVFAQKVGAGGDTLRDAFDTQLIVPAGAVGDSTHLFLVRTPPPSPLIEQDNVVIQMAQAIGSMAPDSTVQSVAFAVPASLQLIDSVATATSDPWQAYRFDAANRTWVKIAGASYQNDTLFVIPVQGTGVYGVGRGGSKRNEYPVISAFRDTIIAMNRSITLPFEAYDPEGESLTLWAESDRPEVTTTLSDSTLTVTPAENWAGVATISLYATDGQDTSKSSFRLGVVDLTATGPLKELPKQFVLYQNYPNPFSHTTTIPFDVPKISRVRLYIFNILGQRVRMLLDNTLAPGQYQVRWDGRDDSGEVVGSGIYLYVLRAAGYVLQRRMVLVK